MNVDISRTLVKNNVGGCGQYMFRASAFDRDEYMVHCSRDGSTWTAYIVWPSINKVQGPLQPSLR